MAASGEHPRRGSPGDPCSALLANYFVTNHRDVALRQVKPALQIGGPRSPLPEEGHAIYLTAPPWGRRRNRNLAHLRDEVTGPRSARSPCISCATTLVKISEPHEMHDKPDPSFFLGRIPDTPPVVLGRRAHLNNVRSTNFDSGPRGCLAAQPALTSSVLPLDALASANVANMHPSLSKWPAWRSGAQAPATTLARQPSLADADARGLNLTDKSEVLFDESQVYLHAAFLFGNSTGKSETLCDESQVAVRSGFLFGKDGGNGGAKGSEFGRVREKEAETRLANIADVVSILFLMKRLMEGLVEWSWSSPCPDSELGWFQQEGILLPCL